MSAQQDLLLLLTPVGKEKSAVLDSFGNMHSGVQERPKNKGMYKGKGKRREDTLLGVAVFCFFLPAFLHVYLFFPLLWFVYYFFPDTNGVLQQAAVMASHLQVKEASGRVGI